MPPESPHYPASFKAAVALEALRGTQPLDALALRFGVPAVLIEAWAGVLAGRAEAVFAAPASEAESEFESDGGDFFGHGELAKIIAENSTQGLAMMNARGYCIYANKAWLRMTGYTAEEIGAKPLHYLVHHHHPDGSVYPIEDCPIDRALPENFGVRMHEDLFFRKDGASFQVACAASPVFRAGKPVATVIEIRDVTEQKRQAEQRLDSERRALDSARAAEEQQRRLNAFLDAAPVGIGMSDASGRIILVNRANHALWGQDQGQAGSVAQYDKFKGWWADGGAHHGEPLRAEDWALARAVRGHDVDNDIVEIAPLDRPDTRKVISLSARPIRDAAGVLTGAVVAQVDITRQKRAEDALRQADRNKDDFIAILAHELRNPLAPIRAAVDLFQMLAPDNPVLKRATEAMGRQVDHITHLVDDLLDVARISRGKVALRCEPCDLAAIVRETASDYRPTIEAAGVTLALDLPDGPLAVEGDATRLAQVVGNLLHNAAKFTRRGGRIAVRLAREPEAGGAAVAGAGVHAQAVLQVEDDGAGIAPELMATLFTPFTQAAQGLGRSSGGLGLGLALVKGLVELHGGSATAASPGLGLGATFCVRMPAAVEAAPAGAPGPDAAGAAGLRIVLIDDNRDALEMLGALLEMNGHAVDTAVDGATGLASVKALRPDAVVCDIGLPGGMDGYAVSRAIRADPGLAGILLIALSGYGQEGDKRKSADAGFDAHLVKPVRHPDLEAALRNARGRHKR
jgi:PAS domain S-box-containing protein